MLSLGNKLTLNTQPIYKFVNKYSIDFDGVDDCIVTDDADTVAQPTTYSFWCKSSVTGANTGVFGHGASNQGGFHFNWSSNRPLLYLGNGWFVFWNDTSAQDDGEWHHWVVYADTNNVNNCKLYVDGVLQTVNQTDGSGSLQPYTESLTIGGEKVSGGNYFEGKIDEFAVFDRELTQAEITRMYNSYYTTNLVSNGTFEQIGLEEVANGDFSEEGSELITDGDFPTGTTAWSMTNNTGTNTRIENNHLIIETDGAYTQAEQLNVTVGGNQYKLVYTVLNSDGGDLALVTEGNTPSSIPNSVGTHIYYFTSHSTSFILKRRSGALNITITNISVKEATIDNLPRVDYTDGTSSLLVEPQRTNLITYSEDFSQSDWTKQGATTISATNITSPIGTTNATRITGLTGSGSNDLKFITGIDPANKTYTATFYLKGSNTLRMQLSNGVDDAVSTTIILTSSWVRYSITHTFNSTSSDLRILLDDNGVTATTYDVWGSQLEIGSYATSYIKTLGSTVTRNQETYTKTGISNLINSEEGVLFAEIAALANDGTFRVIEFNDGTSSNRVALFYNSSNYLTAYVFNGSVQYNYSSNVSGSDFHKVAFKYKASDFALWIDGIEVNTKNSGTVFSANTLNELQFNDGSNSANFFGKVKQLQVYKTALTDSELATLTT